MPFKKQNFALEENEAVGKGVLVGNLGKYYVSFPENTEIRSDIGSSAPIAKWSSQNNTLPMIPACFLRREGEAIASLFEDVEENTFHAYLKKLTEFLPDTEVKEYKKDNNKVEFVQIWKNGKPLPRSENMDSA